MRKRHHKKFKNSHCSPAFINRLWNFLISSTMEFMLAILALIIGYYQFYISRPILEYSSSTDQIVSSSPDTPFHLHINGVDYHSIYKSTVSLTNCGEAALQGDDVSPKGHDPIRIPIPPQVKVLYYAIDTQDTSPDVDAKLEPGDNAVLIKFSFLNPGDNITVNLFSEHNYDQFKVVGSAVGVNKISRTLSHRQTRRILVICGIFLLIFYIFLTYRYFHHHKRLPRIQNITPYAKKPDSHRAFS